MKKIRDSLPKKEMDKRYSLKSRLLAEILTQEETYWWQRSRDLWMIVIPGISINVPVIGKGNMR